MLLRLLLALALLPAASQAAQPLIGVAAKVGADIVTDQDLEAALLPMLAAMSPAERQSSEGRKKLAEARRQVLDRIVETKLVILAAKEGPAGFKEAQAQGKMNNNPWLPEASETEAELERRFDQLRRAAPSQEAFEADLAQERMSVPEFRSRLREQIRDQLIYNNMLKLKERELQASLRVGDEEARAFFEENRGLFGQGAQVNLRHILFPKDGRAKAQAQLDLLKQAKDPKAAFVEMARKLSLDEPTRDQGGRLGWIEKGQSWPELEAAAFAAAPGSLAGPVKTEAGWHLLYVEGRQSLKQRGFEEVKAEARNRVYQEKMGKRIKEWVEELKTKYYVERGQAEARP